MMLPNGTAGIGIFLAYLLPGWIANTRPTSV
ncbi:hypothetical protein J2S92_002845 [Arthrobacter bambusae]|nr:hypothetical protein [Arthrobacter bambusae]MDQ0236626.1 hypothetical protein [Arthrobacter bambusae]